MGSKIEVKVVTETGKFLGNWDIPAVPAVGASVAVPNAGALGTTDHVVTAVVHPLQPYLPVLVTVKP